MLSRLRRLSRPVDGASLAIFRIAFGAIIIVQVALYFTHDWIADYYMRPRFHFGYPGLGWIRPWAGVGMYAHFGLLGFFALMVALGALYRATSIMLWLSLTYVLLLDKARYVNDLYAAVLFAFLLAIVPAYRVYSLHGLGSRRRSVTAVPVWCVWLLRAQVGVIFVFGAISKFGPGWFRGEPMRSWFIDRAEGSQILSGVVANPFQLGLFSYGGLIFDLVIVPFLLWRRTRPLAFAGVVAFELANAKLFDQGMFAWIVIAATTLFFEPDWPRKIRILIERMNGGVPSPRPRIDEGWPTRSPIPTLRREMAGLIIAYLALQVLIPLRRFVYPSGVAWTDYGRRFTWRPRLHDRLGSARFVVTDVYTQQSSVIEPATILDDWQQVAMIGSPEMTLQFAHYLAGERGRVHKPVEVRAKVVLALDPRETRSLVDSTVNLAREGGTVWPAYWITRGPDVPYPRGRR